MNPQSAVSRSAFTFVLLALSLRAAVAAEPALQLKDNDLWVMAGDSITAQRLHTNFLEAFYRTRYPKLHLHFRNSGIGGNRTGNILQRFDYDIAAWKPTIVSVELGMNDVNGPEETYVQGLKEIVAKIRAIPAQPVLISSSPVDDGSIMGDWKSPRCEKLHAFTDAMKKLAAEEKIVFVDQYHPLVDLWGKNRRKGAELAAQRGTPPPPAATPAPVASPAAGSTPPAKPAAPALTPSAIPLGGDAVHTGPVGQYTMAATILEGLHASGAVSSATLKASGAVVAAEHCRITEVAAKEGQLSFTRLDDSGPWPILPKAKAALDLLPSALNLSQYLLRVTGLAEGTYRVSINGQPAGAVTAQQLASGWNMTADFEGPLGARAETIAALIAKLESPLNNNWRAASKAKDAEKLAAAQTAIDDCEKEIQAAVQPIPLHFEIAR